MHTLRVLHISDLHDRAERETEAFRRRRVLDDAWKRNLDALVANGPADLLCFTGDLADWGRAAEYDALTPFLDETRARVGVPWERVFVVPGNHDIARRTEEAAWSTLRSIKPHEYDQFSSWMAGGPALRGIDDSVRDVILRRQSAYRAWVRDTVKRPELVPDVSSPHPRLGYRITIAGAKWPFPVHVLGLDSAWLAGDDSDNGKLMLTDAQVGRLASGPRGEDLDGFRVALMHHPLDQLSDGGTCRRLLAERVDLLLRGHLHDTDPSTWKDPSRELRELAAGCLYEHDRYPSACHMLTAVCDDRGRPLAYDLHLRAWSSKGSHWFDDNGLSPKVRNGMLRWWSGPGVTTGGGPLPPTASATVARTPTPAVSEPDDRELRAVLLRYYDRIPSIRILLRHAGADISSITFENPVRVVWDDALVEVRRAGCLRRLLELACEQFPNSADLRALVARLSG